jgi:hypothetical protein
VVQLVGHLRIDRVCVSIDIVEFEDLGSDYRAQGVSLAAVGFDMYFHGCSLSVIAAVGF